MVFNCIINAFSNLTSIIYLYNENMNLEMTIKKLGSAYKFRVGRATGNEHIFLFGLMLLFVCGWMHLSVALCLVGMIKTTVFD